MSSLHPGLTGRDSVAPFVLDYPVYCWLQTGFEFSKFGINKCKSSLSGSFDGNNPSKYNEGVREISSCGILADGM